MFCWLGVCTIKLLLLSSCFQQGCICQISLGGVEVLAIEVDDRANAYVHRNMENLCVWGVDGGGLKSTPLAFF